jgi:hypothetical protein
VSGQRHAPAALLPPGKGPPVPIVQEAGWAPEPVWTQRIEDSIADIRYKSVFTRHGCGAVITPASYSHGVWIKPRPRSSLITQVFSLLYSLPRGKCLNILHQATVCALPHATVVIHRSEYHLSLHTTGSLQRILKYTKMNHPGDLVHLITG